MYDSSKFLKLEDIKVDSKTNKLMKTAEKTYFENFDGNTWYGRCIFISWYCSIADCTFCYRSTPKHEKMFPKNSRRSMHSILLEALFCRIFNWRIEFLTGGLGIMSFNDLLEIVKNVSKVFGRKIWLNLGVFSSKHLELLKPYVSGICGSMETLNPELHKKICPSKPIDPYDKMFSRMNGFRKSIAVIVGLGESLENIKYLFDFVNKHDLNRVTIYALKPVKGTGFVEGPSVNEHFSWISSLRIRFPKLEIIAGTNLRRCEEVGYLMNCGVNAITKFPATKQFGTKKAHLVHELIEKENRKFISNIVNYEDINWIAEIDKLTIKKEYKDEMKKTVVSYINTFQNPVDKDSALII